ncbi:hypothetical protein EDC96DRAFT_491931 [Choanephora cucurbitarum]|nr:hypothetical protein EDC96DRAFT_491930 [Choanephora cucurbitarum]KAI8379845.1 hypothetical protein EDC96DRAFT_491931 [Choanephora cucurbitarum]
MLFRLAFSNYVFFFLRLLPSLSLSLSPSIVETLRPIFFSSICSWLVAKRLGMGLTSVFDITLRKMDLATMARARS